MTFPVKRKKASTRHTPTYARENSASSTTFEGSNRNGTQPVGKAPQKRRLWGAFVAINTSVFGVLLSVFYILGALKCGTRRRDLLVDSNQQLRIPMAMDVELLAGDNNNTNVMLQLCDVDLAPYHRHPPVYPFYHNIIADLCIAKGGDVSYTLASELAKNASAGKYLQPAGFILHEGRVGSTLVANMLASVPSNLVYPEPTVPLFVMLKCQERGCTEEEAVRLLRTTILAMGRIHHHDRFFIKFQSHFVPYKHILLKAFPDTPWIFVYRDPVETMVSNLKGKNRACLLEKKQSNPPKSVQKILGVKHHAAAIAMSDEDYCAAHLAMLCETAAEHLNTDNSKGQVVAFDNLLVGNVLTTIIPIHFGVPLNEREHERMQQISAIYSKSGAGSAETRLFKEDGNKKQEEATHAIQAAVEKYLKRPMALLQQGHDRQLNQGTDYVLSQSPSACPDIPQDPALVPVLDIVANWNPNNVTIPPRHYHSLCRFDYQTESAKALRYREAGVPFVVYNIPELDAAVAKWATPGYLEGLLGTKAYPVDVSQSNHFRYYDSKKVKESISEDDVLPFKTERYTYRQWLDKIQQSASYPRDAAGKRQGEHYYFRPNSKQFYVEDLAFFDPRRKVNLFVHDPSPGFVNCRFGAPGVITEGHFDGPPNMVAVVSGTRRWILAPPVECKNANLFPLGHPSERQSQLDWATPDLMQFPNFAKMKATEVLLTAGDVLFVPSYWLHHVSSLDKNVQCNAFSGNLSSRGKTDVERCGFVMQESPPGQQVSK